MFIANYDGESLVFVNEILMAFNIHATGMR